MRIRLVLLLGLLLFVSNTVGQSTSGSITGVITGPQGAVVADAPIQAKNSTTGAAARTLSKPDGQYTLTNLAPGPYDITINMPCCAFKGFNKTGVIVRAGQEELIEYVCENNRAENMVGK